MNQFSNFRFIQFAQQRSCIILSVVLLVMLVSLSVQAQDGWQSPPALTDQRNLQSNWQTNDVVKASANVEPPTTWPNKVVTFDSQVEQAKFDTAASSGSIESMINSTGEKLSRIKEVVATKTTGWFGSATVDQGGAGGLNISKMLGSLALVLGGYFGFVWLMRKISPASNSQLPVEVVQILGRTAFGSRQNLQLVRLGSKLVLLLNGPEGTHPIGEITDPAEVQHLISLCAPKRHVRPTFFSRMSTPEHRQTESPRADVDPSVSSGLANVLRSLEQVAKQQGRSVFEA